MNWIIRLEKICEKYGFEYTQMDTNVYAIDHEFVFAYYEEDKMYYVEKILHISGDRITPPDEDYRNIGRSADMKVSFRLLLNSIFDFHYNYMIDCETDEAIEQELIKIEIESERR